MPASTRLSFNDESIACWPEKGQPPTYLRRHNQRPDVSKHLDLEVIFPIKDSTSAYLMLLKAKYLFAAGVISRAERMAVEKTAAPLELKSYARLSDRKASGPGRGTTPPKASLLPPSK